MHDLQGLSLQTGLAGDLHQAAGVRRYHQFGTRFDHVAHFPSAQAAGHFRFGEIVGSRGAATEFRFWQIDQLKTGDLPQQIARLFPHLLRVGQVASIVIRCFGAEFTRRRNQSEFIEKFADIFDLVGERLPLPLVFVFPVMAVILQHRTTTGHVGEDRFDSGTFESAQILIGKFSGRLRTAGMKMNGAAAALVPGDHHVTTILLEYPHRRPVGGAKDGISYATGKQCHTGSAFSLGRIDRIQGG